MITTVCMTQFLGYNACSINIVQKDSRTVSILVKKTPLPGIHVLKVGNCQYKSDRRQNSSSCFPNYEGLRYNFGFFETLVDLDFRQSEFILTGKITFTRNKNFCPVVYDWKPKCFFYDLPKSKKYRCLKIKNWKN